MQISSDFSLNIIKYSLKIDKVTNFLINSLSHLKPHSNGHQYRLSHLLVILGWADLDFECSTICPNLPGKSGWAAVGNSSVSVRFVLTKREAPIALAHLIK